MNQDFQESENILDYQEYYLIKDNRIYKIIIGQNSIYIFIKCNKYMIRFNNEELSFLTKIKFENIDKAYEFLINIFEENKVYINKIIMNKSIQLIFINKKKMEIILNYDKRNFDLIINEINVLKINNNNNKELTLNHNKESYNKLLEQINKINNEIKDIKKNYKKYELEISKLKNNNNYNLNSQKKNNEINNNNIYNLNRRKYNNEINNKYYIFNLYNQKTNKENNEINNNNIYNLYKQKNNNEINNKHYIYNKNNEINTNNDIILKEKKICKNNDNINSNLSLKQIFSF